VSDWTVQFAPPERTPDFFPVVRDVLRPWHEADVMWVFAFWGEAFETELTAMTLTDEEHVAWRKALLAERGAHPPVMLRGERVEVTMQSNCLACHVTTRRVPAVALPDEHERD